MTMAPTSAKVQDSDAFPAIKAFPTPEAARGGCIWRVAAAFASGFFHATTEMDEGEGAILSGASPPFLHPPSALSSAAASAFFAADAADFPAFVDEGNLNLPTKKPFLKHPHKCYIVQLVDLICNFTPHDDRPDLFRLLRVLDTRVGTLLLAGRGGGITSSSLQKKKTRLCLLPRRFPDFSPEEKEAVLLRWMKSKGPLGQAARGLKSLVFLALFRFVEQGEALSPSSSSSSLSLLSSSSAPSSSAVYPHLRKENPFWNACSYSSPSLLLHEGAANGGSSPRNRGRNASNGSNKRTSSSLSSSSSANRGGVTVSSAKVATEATLLARTVDASKLSDMAEASARFSALGFSPIAAGNKEIKDKDNVVDLSADVVVIGSGAGGGVAAALLAASGLRVVVLEKGRYFAVSQVGGTTTSDNFEALDLSEKAFSQTYERGTLCSTRDLSVTALAGSTLGGGTRINWCASFPTPDHVREEWSKVGGLPVEPATSACGEKEGGAERVSTTRFDRALTAVCSRMRVSVNVGASNCATSSSSCAPLCGHNGPNSKLAEGLVALGKHAGRVPRNCAAASTPTNANSAIDCGSCCFSGCPSGDKQDHTHTFLADAASAGALILTGVMADRVLLEKNKMEKNNKKTFRRKFVAAGVEATPLPAGSPLPFDKKGGNSFSSSSSSSKKHLLRLVIRAPIVVAAAGSLHTPALLLRSGLKNKNIGRGLRLHPSLVVLGRFPRNLSSSFPRKEEEKKNGDIEDCSSVRMDKGPIMSAFGKGSADWEGSGYGPLLMTPSLHLAGFAATVPWRGNAEFKKLLSSYGDWSPVLVLTRDGGGGKGKRGGRVSLDSQGQPRFDFKPSKADARAMAKGAAAAVEALAAAGAVEIGSFLRMSFLSLPPLPLDDKSTSCCSVSPRPSISKGERKLAVENYKKKIETTIGPKAIRSGGRCATIISAHQMGTARAGPSPKSGAVEGATGESWEVENLFVSDASLFPTASGVNPMISICALSWMVAEGIAEREMGHKRTAAGLRSVLARSVSLTSPSSSSSVSPSVSTSPVAILREAIEGGSGLPLSISSCGRVSVSR